MLCFVLFNAACFFVFFVIVFLLLDPTCWLMVNYDCVTQVPGLFPVVIAYTVIKLALSS